MRKEAADPTITLYNGNAKIIGSLTGLKVDPWGFLLPLTPMVWAATLMALLGVLAVQQLLPSSLHDRMLCGDGGWSANTFRCVRVILQQGETLPEVVSLSCLVAALRVEGFRAIREK